MGEVQRWGRSEGGGGPKVGDLKQQDRKTNEVDSMTILRVRLAEAGKQWPWVRLVMAGDFSLVFVAGGLHGGWLSR